jgi:hypothetical protein
LCGGLKHGPEKAIECRHDRCQVAKLGPPGTSHECRPLNLLLSVASEFAGQRERAFARDLDTSARKRRGDGKPHRLAVEGLGLGQPVDMSKKSFIRLFANASRTIASVFSAIDVSGR